MKQINKVIHKEILPTKPFVFLCKRGNKEEAEGDAGENIKKTLSMLRQA